MFFPPPKTWRVGKCQRNKVIKENISQLLKMFGKKMDDLGLS